MTKTKHFTYCNDELIDDPLTQSYIDDPRAFFVLDHMHTYNHLGIRSTGRMGRKPSSHVRITPASLKLAERLKNEYDMYVFPAQFPNRQCHTPQGGSSWTMYIIEYKEHPATGTVGSDWPVRELNTCKGKFDIHPMDFGDFEIYPDEEDNKRLTDAFRKKVNRRYP